MPLKYPFIALASVFLSATAVRAQPGPSHTEYAQPGIECVEGFGDRNGSPRAADVELKCDEANLGRFMAIIGRCYDSQSAEIKFSSRELRQFDMDHDGCVTCRDFKAWKVWLKSAVGKGFRTSDGASIRADHCDD